ncbi:MAG: hypothetical protein AAF648_07450 [Pseudomonadota bacterium]
MYRILTSAHAMLVLAMLCFSSSAQAVTVLGCTLGPDVPAFTSCIVNSSTNAATEAANDARDAVMASPAMAKAEEELALLNAARNSGLAEVSSCLASANRSLASIITSVSSNPENFARNRLQVYMNAVQAAGPGQLLSRFDPSTQTTPPSPQQLIDDAFAGLESLVGNDPVADCLLPLLEDQEQQIKAASLQAFNQIQSQLSAIEQTVVTPEIKRRQAQLMATMYATMREARTATDRRERPAAPMRRVAETIANPRTPARRAPATIGNATGSSSRVAPTKKQPRTRNAETLFAETARVAERIQAGAQSAVEAALPSGQRLIESSLPNDVQRIALGEFAGHVLAPEPLTVAAQEVERMASAVGRGQSPQSSSELERLVDQLELENEEMYVRISVSTLRFYGHWVIDEAGYPLVDWLWGHLAGMTTLVDKVVGQICVVAHWASGLPCAGVRAVIQYVVHAALITSVTKTSVMAMHAAWENAVVCGAAALSNEAPANYCSALQPLLEGFPRTNQQALSFIMPHLNAMQRAIYRYQRAVAQLARTIAARS